MRTRKSKNTFLAKIESIYPQYPVQIKCPNQDPRRYPKQASERGLMKGEKGRAPKKKHFACRRRALLSLSAKGSTNDLEHIRYLGKSKTKVIYIVLTKIAKKIYGKRSFFGQKSFQHTKE
jgi:hypothetical protein